MSSYLQPHGLFATLQGFSVHGISQARILEQVAISFSRGSSQPSNQTWISCLGKQILYHWATWETLFVIISIMKSLFLCIKHKCITINIFQNISPPKHPQLLNSLYCYLNRRFLLPLCNLGAKFSGVSLIMWSFWILHIVSYLFLKDCTPFNIKSHNLLRLMKWWQICSVVIKSVLYTGQSVDAGKSLSISVYNDW